MSIKKRVQPPRKKVLLAMEWYDHDINVGVMSYAHDAGWILDDSAAHTRCLIPPGWKGDGIIALSSTETSPLAGFLRRARIPVVDLSPGTSNSRFSHVKPDNVAIGRTAGEEMLGRGFVRFGFFVTADAAVVLERMQGFRSTVDRPGLDFHVLDYSEMYCRHEFHAIIPRLGRHLKKLPKPIAIMAQFDADANVVVRACLDAGLRVPEDVAVIGVDNDPIHCRLGLVPLSSVVSNLEQVGYRGAQVLDSMMNGEPRPKEPILIAPGGVVVRRSTDVLAAEDNAVSRALAFIAGHLQDRIPVKDIVAASGVSRSVLFAKFAKQLGHSVHQELLRQRVAKAKIMLSTTDEKTSIVAAKCGLAGHKGLWSAFRCIEGMTPSQFKVSEQLRQKHRKRN